MAEQTNADGERVERELDKMDERIEGVKDRLHEDMFSGPQDEVYGELTTVDQYQADYGTETFDRELTLTQERIIEAKQQEIAAAKRKAEEGTYGFCENCGRPIDPERLAVRPESVLCINCQRLREREMYGETT